MAAMGEEAEFANHIEMQEYAERNGLDYAWSGTALFAKRKRTLPPDQFEVRVVRTRRGITMVGLLSAAITRAERDALDENRPRQGRGGDIGAIVGPKGPGEAISGPLPLRYFKPRV
jgi:hypothetical protein